MMVAERHRDIGQAVIGISNPRRQRLSRRDDSFGIALATESQQEGCQESVPRQAGLRSRNGAFGEDQRLVEAPCLR
jgi:hypothetical protein